MGLGSLKLLRPNVLGDADDGQTGRVVSAFSRIHFPMGSCPRPQPFAHALAHQHHGRRSRSIGGGKTAAAEDARSKGGEQVERARLKREVPQLGNRINAFDI